VRDPRGELEPQAFLCTDLDANPLDILRWFIRRWSTEVTFAEVHRRRRGVPSLCTLPHKVQRFERSAKRYHMGFREPVRCSTPADANETRERGPGANADCPGTELRRNITFLPSGQATSGVC
jgi:hypothetical protein